MAWISVAYSQQNEEEILSLAENCSNQLDRGLLNSSCLLLGIYMKGRDRGQRFNTRIETICLDLLLKDSKDGKMDFREYLEPFLKYYPKCSYVLRQQDQRKKNFEKITYEGVIQTLYSY